MYKFYIIIIKMTKTNREFRSDLAKEMRDKRKERDEQLRQIDKLPLSEPVKESAKKDIMEAFYKQMEEFKSRPWYEEARKTHSEEINAKVWVNKLKKEKEKLQKEYEEKLAHIDEEIEEKNEVYEDAQIKHRWEVEYWEVKRNLIWNYNGVMEDLQHNHITIKENSEYMWLKWIELHFTLPAVWKFKWYKFDCFISDSTFRFDEMDRYNWRYNFYDINELCELWDALKTYLEEYKIDIDAIFKNYEIKTDIEEQNILTTTKIWLPILFGIIWKGPFVIWKYEALTEDFSKFYRFSCNPVVRRMHLIENVSIDKWLKFLLKQ